MTAAPGLPGEGEWTVDDLAKVPPDLRYELIDGRLIILPSPTFLHQELCLQVVFTLRQNCPRGWLPGIDLSLKVDSRNEPRPDVVVADPRHGRRSRCRSRTRSSPSRSFLPPRTGGICATRSASTRAQESAPTG